MSHPQESQQRAALQDHKTWVIKIGSSMLTHNGEYLDEASIAAWCGQLAALHQAGKDVLLVTSGAVAAGMQELGWQERPKRLADLQSAAAVGQMLLCQVYRQIFKHHAISTAQILLTHEDAADRNRYLNIRDTLHALLQQRIIPIINENDTVSYKEICFGDNDTLGALLCNLSGANIYVILTDQAGLYSADPRKNPDAYRISSASALDDQLLSIAGEAGSKIGTGGMYTKIQAARKAAASGTHTLIVGGNEENVITRIAAGEDLGTLLIAENSPHQARKQWLGAQQHLQGSLYLDAGACEALLRRGKSLLPVGVIAVEGDFARGALVRCLSPSHEEIARGLISYSSNESRALIGQHADDPEVSALLVHGKALIHRDNLVLT